MPSPVAARCSVAATSDCPTRAEKTLMRRPTESGAGASTWSDCASADAEVPAQFPSPAGRAGRLQDVGGTSSGLLRGVDQRVAGRVLRDQLQEALPDALVELAGLGLDAVGLGAARAAAGAGAAPSPRRRAGRAARSGRAAARTWPSGRACADRLRVQPAAVALIGDGGVDVAVGDDDRAALERRPDHAGDVLGAVGGVEQGLRLGRSSRRSGRAAAGAAAAPTGVSPGSRVTSTSWPSSRRAVGEPLGLGGLARTLAALEGDEAALVRRDRRTQVAAPQRLPDLRQDGDTRPVVHLPVGDQPDGHGDQAAGQQHQR